MVSGVTMNGSPLGTMGACPADVRCSLTICPHEVAAGDHTTGRGPLAFSSQFDDRSCAAAPDDLFCGRTKMQSLPTLALSVPLKDFASDVIRSPFSGEVAMSTTMHFPGPASD